MSRNGLLIASSKHMKCDRLLWPLTSTNIFQEYLMWRHYGAMFSKGWYSNTCLRLRPSRGFRCVGCLSPSLGKRPGLFVVLFHVSSFDGRRTSSVQSPTRFSILLTPLHLVPSAPNFAAVDSIVYDPNEALTGLTCLQMTVSHQHDIKVPGLQKIQNWLKLDTPLEHLHPSNPREERRLWRLIFIVPSDDAAFFEKQSFIDDTDLGEWDGKVYQYVVGLDVKNQSSV